MSNKMIHHFQMYKYLFHDNADRPQLHQEFEDSDCFDLPFLAPLDNISCCFSGTPEFAAV